MAQADSPTGPEQRFAGLIFVSVATIGLLGAGWSLLAEAGLVAWLEAWSAGKDWVAATRGSLLANPTFYLLLVLGLMAEVTHIPLPRGGRMTAGFLINFAALLMLGLNAAIAVLSVVSLLTALIPPRRRLGLAAFQIGQLTLAYLAAHTALTYGHVYIYGYPGADDNVYVARAVVAYLTTHFLIVDGYLALQRGVSPLKILWDEDRTEIFVTIAMAPMALLMAYMHREQGWWGASLVLLPMFTTAYGVRLYIQVKRSEEALAEFNRQLTILQQVATRISSQIDLEQTLALIAHEMRRVIRYDDCQIFLLDPGQSTLVKHVQASPQASASPLTLPLGHGLIGQVARDRRAARIDDLQRDAMDVGVLAGFRSLLAVPVATDQEVLGVIALLNTAPHAFDAVAEKLLSILASQAAVAIKNAQLYRATQQLAITDGLTKIYNRRYFEEQLNAELARAKRYKHTTSLVVLDVDHFKKFNDAHGHLLGDQVLQGVARILLKSVRETDVVARYGGEEFVVVLPETPADAALEVAERIRRNIKSHPFWGRGQTPLQVTASLGLAADVLSLLPAQALFEQADKALYQAKSEGRDRVCRVVCAPDEAPAITTSRKDAAKEPTLRRQMRSAMQMSVEDWSRYLQGHFPQVIQDWWKEDHVETALKGGEKAWSGLAHTFATKLVAKLTSNEDERNGWLERFQEFTVYPEVRAELDRLICQGTSLLQLEHAVLALHTRSQSLVRGAPFSLEERMTVSLVQERLFQVLQLMVAQAWQDQLASAHEQAAGLASAAGSEGPSP
ncbi:MAG: sensor domain-containing diguanylate cyclase [Candidatus Sericytochromatia bacterium]|nr:sensor domain-containing diguanylate cyclase [Candidatus Sericytochromatia bacterium]